MSRRKFLKNTVIAGAALGLSNKVLGAAPKKSTKIGNPTILSTWNFSQQASKVGWDTLMKGLRALDACEQGVRVVEADPSITSVGIGGLPDRDGRVTLDACVMDESGNCGSVGFLEDILHPVSVARKVMEKTPHVYLMGSGARQFALENGFTTQELLTLEAKEEWLKWKKDNNYFPSKYAPAHDTIGMIALDKNGNLGGACSTSGWGFKMRGRVGDSPIIGCGLYVDNEVGAVVATGFGELMIKTCGSFLITEYMRMGKSPQEACELAVKRVYDRYASNRSSPACYVALSKDGTIGAYSMNKGFQYVLTNASGTKLIDTQSLR